MDAIDYQAAGGSLRNHSSGHYHDHGSQQSSSGRSSSGRSSGSNGSRRPDRDGMGKSRDYFNFRKFKDRDRQRDFDSCDWESRSAAAVRDDFKSFSTCKSERDRMNRTRSKADTWNKGSGSTSRNNAVSSSRSNDKSSTVASTGTVNSVINAALGTSISNASVRTSVSNTSISNAVSNASNAASITFEREFPQLSSEDKNGRQSISKVPSPGISTAIQNVPMISPDGWSSMLADLPLLSDPKKSLATSSLLHIAPGKQAEVVPNSGTALNMAETVMQAPLRISIRPQVTSEPLR